MIRMMVWVKGLFWVNAFSMKILLTDLLGIFLLWMFHCPYTKSHSKQS